MNHNELDLEELFADLYRDMEKPSSIFPTSEEFFSSAPPARYTKECPPQTQSKSGLNQYIKEAMEVVTEMSPSSFDEESIIFGNYNDHVERSIRHLMFLLKQMNNCAPQTEPSPYGRTRELENQLGQAERQTQQAKREVQDLMMQIKLLQSEKAKDLDRERLKFQKETAEMRKKLAEYERTRPTENSKRAVVNLSHLNQE